MLLKLFYFYFFRTGLTAVVAVFFGGEVEIFFAAVVAAGAAAFFVVEAARAAGFAEGAFAVFVGAVGDFLSLDGGDGEEEFFFVAVPVFDFGELLRPLREASFPEEGEATMGNAGGLS